MQAKAGNRTIELRITEAEDSAVRGVEPVAAIVSGRHDADDGSLRVGCPSNRERGLSRR